MTPISSAIAEKIKSLSTTGTLFGMPCPSPMPNNPPVPVSYTHLDVYKRQDISHVNNNPMSLFPKSNTVKKLKEINQEQYQENNSL